MQSVRVVRLVFALALIPGGIGNGMEVVSPEPLFGRSAPEGMTFRAVLDRDSARLSPAAGSDDLAHDLAAVLAPLTSGQMRILYLAAYGAQVHLRVRRIPYPGAEAVLWSGVGELAHTSYLPSPDFARAAVLLNVGQPGMLEYKLAVVRLDGSGAETIPGIPLGNELRYAVWEDESTLLLLTKDTASNEVSEWRLSLGDPSLTLLRSRPRDWNRTLQWLASRFSESIALLSRAARENRVNLGEDEAAEAVLRAVGVPTHPDFSSMTGMTRGAVAAVSPDRKHIALVGRDSGVLSVVGTAAGGAEQDLAAKCTDLVAAEAVYLEDPRWSPDSRSLVFTEVHFHPARPHVPADVRGGDFPPAWDWTYLVRLYSLDDGTTETVAVGRSAFVMPTPWVGERSTPDLPTTR